MHDFMQDVCGPLPHQLCLCTLGVCTILKEVHRIFMKTTVARIIIYTHMHVHLGAKVPCWL